MSSAALKARGDAAFKAKDYAGAIRSYGEALDLAPSDAKIFSNRAACYLAVGDYLRALDDAERAVGIDPDFAKAYGRKGEALMQLQRYEDAADVYGEASRRDPSSASYTTKQEQARKLAASGSATEGIMAFAVARREQVLHFVLRLFLIYNALIFLMPFFGRGVTWNAYRRVIFGSCLSLLITLKNEVGFPRFNMTYLANFMKNIAAQYLFFALIMFASPRPYLFALPVLLLSEVAHVFWFGSQLLRRASPSALRMAQRQVDRVLPVVLKYHDSIPAAVVHYSTLAEVVLGITMLIEVLTPSRNLFTLLFYWQYLQMRYLLDPTGSIKNAFRLVDTRILRVVRHPRCPSIIGKAYDWIRNAMARAAQPPQPPGEPAAEGSRGGLAGMASQIASRCVVS